jgi:hypothetical protein
MRICQRSGGSAHSSHRAACAKDYWTKTLFMADHRQETECHLLGFRHLGCSNEDPLNLLDAGPLATHHPIPEGNTRAPKSRGLPSAPPTCPQ